MTQPLADLVPDFDDHSVEAVAESIFDLLAHAATGHPEALEEARARYRGLYDYLSRGTNPLPAQWSHSTAWRSPEHDPTIQDEVEATYAAQSATLAQSATVEPSPFVLVEGEDDQWGFDLEALATLPDPTPVTAHAPTDLAEQNARERVWVRDFVVHPGLGATIAAAEQAEQAERAALPAVPAPVDPDAPRPPRKKVVNTAQFNYNTPLGEVRNYVHDEENGKIECPACTATVATYTRAVHKTIAKSLMKMYHLGGKDERGWVWVARDIGEGCEISKARFFNLVEQQSAVNTVDGKVGRWRLTEAGVDFVLNRATVPQKALVRVNRLLRYVDESVQISIKDALKEERGQYNDFMSGSGENIPLRK